MTERTQGPFMTKIGEFFYRDNDSQVKSGQEYIIAYMKNKDVVYTLTSTDEEIVRDHEVMQESYTRVASSLQIDKEPKEVFPTIKKLNFDAKYITRTFAKSKLNKDADILEVETIVKNPSMTFIKMQWQISGGLDQAIKFNELQLKIAEASMPGISEKINPLQLHESRIVSNESEIDRLRKNPKYSQNASQLLPQTLRDGVARLKRRKKKRVKRGRKVRPGRTSTKLY
jgi:hypothetical protein